MGVFISELQEPQGYFVEPSNMVKLLGGICFENVYHKGLGSITGKVEGNR